MINGLKSLPIVFTSLIGVAITLYGFHGSWPLKLPWQGSALERAVAVLLIGVFFSILISRVRIASTLAGGAVAIFLIALLFNAIWSLLVVAWLAFSSVLLGSIVISLLMRRDSANNILINLAIGVGLYGTLTGLLAHWPVNYPGLYTAALALPIALRPALAFKLLHEIRNAFSSRNTDSNHTVALQATISGFALLYFVVALMPEVGHDALAMHLFVPAHMSLRHQWGFDASTYVWAVMPMLGDWIYTIAYLLGGESAARITNVGFILLIATQVYFLAKTLGASQNGALWSTLLFLSTPLTFTEGSSLFIESIWAFYLIGSILLLLQLCFSHDKKTFSLVTLGVLIGFSLACKAVTIPAMLPAAALLIVFFRRWLTIETLPALISSAILLLIAGGIPYITAWILTDNPTFPFFNGIFKSPLYPAINFDTSAFGKGLQWDTIYKITFHSDKYLEAVPGAAGFQWLPFLIPTALVFLVKNHFRAIAVLAFAVASIFCVFYSSAYLRYVFPQIALLTACMSVMLSSTTMNNSFSRTLLTTFAAAIVTVNFLFLGSGAFYNDFPLKAAADQTARKTYLQHRLPMRNAIEFINGSNIDNANIGIFSPPYSAGLNVDAFYASWYNHTFNSKVTAAQSGTEINNVFCEHNIKYVILNTEDGADKSSALARESTEHVMTFGNVVVQKIGNRNFSNIELLKNSDFLSLDGWTLIGEAKKTSSGILVSAPHPAVQPVSITPGRNYINSVTARCAAKDTEGRIQINWLDSSGKLVKPDIVNFICTKEEAEHSAVFQAPCGATTAMVYASARAEDFLEFQKVSLR